MAENMKVIFYGVRGTRVTPDPLYWKYGSNTSCVFIEKGNTKLVLDTGSGVVNLGRDLIKRVGGIQGYTELPSEEKVINVFNSHLHPDHHEGFPGFAPAFFPDTLIKFIGEKKPARRQDSSDEYVGPEAIYRRTQAGNNYPVRFDPRDRLEEPEPFMPCKKEFYHVAPKSEIKEGEKIGTSTIYNKLDLGDLTIEPIREKHPQGAVGAKVTDKETGASVAYIVDTEHIPGTLDYKILEGIRDVDALLYDSSMSHRGFAKEEIAHLPKEIIDKVEFAVYEKHVGWGHSTLEEAVKLAIAANIGKVIGTHHEPRHIDPVLDLILSDVRSKYPGFDIDLAMEGSVLKIDKGRVTYVHEPNIGDQIKLLARTHNVKL